MGFFRKDFFTWLKEDGFYIKDTWDEEKDRMGGPGRLVLQPTQERILRRALDFDEDTRAFRYNTVLYSTIKKSGKALAIDTPIPTPDGWTTMGELKVGDVVYDERGKSCNVTYTTEVMTGHDCYYMKFSDGTDIVADAEHQWYVRSPYTWRIHTTQEIFDLKRGNQHKFTLPVYGMLECKHKELPIPPYVLMAWLLRGHLYQPYLIVKEGHPGISYIDNENIDYAYDPDCAVGMGGYWVGIENQLFSAGLYGNKHIPEEYLRASIPQRLEMVRALYDFSVHEVTKRSVATVNDAVMCNSIVSLLRTFGIRPYVERKVKELAGGKRTSYRIIWQNMDGLYTGNIHTPGISVYSFRNSPKITEIKKVSSVPVKCIQVDSPSHLYLAGKGMVPTHNTLIAAAVGAWYLECAPDGTEVYVCANSQDQAEGRIMADMQYHFRHRNDAEDFSNWKVVKYKIYNTETGSFAQSLTQSFSSNAGARHALTLFDEVWGISSEADRRMWDEMTPIPTIPNSLRFIATYAGFYNESTLLWELYLRGVGDDEHEDGKGTPIEDMEDLPCWENGRLFTYWNHDPIMPWQKQDYYDNERKSLRAAAYLRLHENRWVSTAETFIPMDWWDYAETRMNGPVDYWPEHPFRGLPVYVGVDASQKRDTTAIVGVAIDPAKGIVGQLFHKIWTPRKEDDGLDLESTVEKYLISRYNMFNIRVVGYDPTFLNQTVIRMRQRGMVMREIIQSGDVMLQASQILYDLLRGRKLWVYKDDEIRSHIQNAVAKQEARGIRIVKFGRGLGSDKPGGNSKMRKPIDYTVALAMACYMAVNNGLFDTVTPIRISSPFSDMSEKKYDPSQLLLPPPLRS